MRSRTLFDSFSLHFNAIALHIFGWRAFRKAGDVPPAFDVLEKAQAVEEVALAATTQLRALLARNLRALLTGNLRAFLAGNLGAFLA